MGEVGRPRGEDTEAAAAAPPHLTGEEQPAAATRGLSGTNAPDGSSTAGKAGAAAATVAAVGRGGVRWPPPTPCGAGIGSF